MITLGKKGSHTSAAERDVVDLLLDCHERIRSMIALARRLAGARGLPDAEIVDAADRVRRYFGGALALHARDEDESVLPRLRGKDAALDRELDEMSREHGEHGPALTKLVDACDAIAEDPSRLAAVSADLEDAASDLERQFGVHLEREERVIFPAIRRLLAVEELARISEELRARRS